jgi:hypothetical protein
MTAFTIALISTACIFGGVLLGLWLQNLLPDHHLSNESKDTIKLGAGLLATLSALILGLLVSSAKNTFDTMNTQITQSAAKLIYLDRLLADYGPETKAEREFLRANTAAGIAAIWPEENLSTTQVTGLSVFEKMNGMEMLQLQLTQLTPTNAVQRQMLPQAQGICQELRQSRWLVIEESQNRLPMPFLAILLFWLTALHFSFGLFAPRNVMVLAVMFTCAVSVSGAIFLILEMNHPLSGLIKVSSAPMLKALQHLGQ